MTCYNTIKGYRSRHLNASGKRPIVFNPHDGYEDMPIEVPCGQCIGCRLERSRQWAMRCVHEAKMYTDNCFITLTFDDSHLATDGSLHKEDFQNFMKRLRKKIYPQKVRYYHCGEYGDQLNRPHHHACLFGFDFDDKKLYTIRKDVKLYTSRSLQLLWPFGYSTIGDVTFESAAYVARYCTKKITGKDAQAHYGDRQPEYTTMSRRPGIGKIFYSNYKSDIYPHDHVVINRNGRNVVVRPPKYYDGLYELEDEMDYKRIKYKRKESAHVEDLDRVAVKEIVKQKQIKQLKRSYENDSEYV